MRWHRVWAELKRDRYIQAVGLLALTLIAVALIAPLFVADPNDLEVTNRLKEPSWLGGTGGALGTDELGRSLLARVTYGLRTSYMVGVLSVLVGAFIGSTAGLVAGYFGGRFDTLIMRVVDVQLALPALLIVMAIVVVSGGGIPVIILVLGISSWTMYARIVRGLVLRMRSTDFVLASRSLGATSPRVLARHVFPNVLPAIVSIATLEFARLMLAEAALSFLGFGVEPPTVSLGAIVAGGRDYLTTSWWLSVIPGLVLALAVLSLNLLGGWLERVGSPTFERVAEEELAEFSIVTQEAMHA